MLSQLPKAVNEQAQKKAENLLAAAAIYSKQISTTPAISRPNHAPVIWRKGSARLLDFGAHMTSPIRATTLIIPSLINRYYILDLSQKRSFVRYLAANGIYPLILDWDEPKETEYSYDMADYVTQIILPALEFISHTTGRKPHLLGYCLGGILALAATQLASQHVASLGLLATPWNFASKDTHAPALRETQLNYLQQHIAASPTLHPLILQWLFMLRQPFAFEKKFLKLAQMKRQSDIDDFISIEHWVNDSVPMASPAAIDCLINWAQKNVLYKKKWRVGGHIISPKHVATPCFVAIPNQDTIVPTDCAQALADALPNVQTCSPKTGHIGMIVGRRAKRELWEPYHNFIINIAHQGSDKGHESI